MKLLLNGVPTEIQGSLTLAELLARHGLKPEAVIVEHNLNVPPREIYESLRLQEGDRVEIVKFMGGG